MPSKVPQIEIPKTDIWSTLFDRTQKPFPDNQIIYQCSTTNRNYTWAQLKKTTEQIGSSLRNQWFWKKGDVLALFSANCIDTPAVTWGCHWAGGVVSPANPAYTVGELTHHLKDCGARVLFTQKALLPTALKATAAAGIAKENIILIGEERDATGQFKYFTDVIDGKPVGKRPEITPDKDLSFLVYSSGTTGLPKGVMLTHTNVVSNLFMVTSCEGEFLKWNRDKVMSVLPYYHIYGLQILVHMPAYIGVTTIVMPGFNLESFCSLIQEHRITYAYVAPPIILHLAKSDIVPKYDLSPLRTIVSGAAPLAKDLIYAVHDRLGIEVKQAYGLSETSPATHVQRQWNSGLGSVGPPLPNQTIKFMSADETEVATGKEGEVWIKGPNVFLGYHNNPSATASSITPDGYFKTGDIGYEDEDGNMFITDRVKELIKYKGFQVAPAELEGILASNDIVNDVAVIGIMDEARATEVPLAFVVAKPGVEQNRENAESIVKWLDTRVAGHKRLRGGVKWISEIPKSASGKILRRVLKDVLAEEKKNEALKAKL